MYKIINEKKEFVQYRENKFQAVSNTVWVCLKSYDSREDNTKGMNE